MNERLDPADIPVVLLAGGQGMRLREETERIPKPMVEVGGRPILWHIMKVFASHGHRRFIICLGYKGWVIKDWFLNYHQRLADLRIELAAHGPAEILGPAGHEDWQVTCAETGLHTGSLGRLRAVARHIDTPWFLYSYGDSIADVDVTAVRQRHTTSDDIVTMTGVRPRSRYGILTSSDDGHVSRYDEKPEIGEGHANGGYMALSTELFSHLEGHDPSGFFEIDVLPDLVAMGRVGLHQHEGFWLGMDTMRDVVALEDLWQSGDAPWKRWD